MQTTLNQFDTDPVHGTQTCVVGTEWLRAFRQKFFALEAELMELKQSHNRLLQQNSRLQQQIISLQANDYHLYIKDTLPRINTLT